MRIINLNNLLSSAFFIVLSLIFISANAQDSIIGNLDINTILAKKFKLQTFQLQQFVDRFNYDEVIEVDNFKSNRNTNLFVLINQADSILLKQAIISQFVDTFRVSTNKLNLKTADWNADVYSQFLYKKQPVEIILSLKLIGTDIKGYSWRITQVSSSLFTPLTYNEKYKIFINPQNNEIMFSELSKLLLSNSSDVVSFYEDSFSYSALSSFRDYIKNKELTFSYISNVKYVFKNISGFDFTVENFIRSKYNAGLLISFIKKNNKQ